MPGKAASTLIGLCSIHDEWCYTAERYLITKYFNSMRGGRARSIKLLSERARSGGISSTLYNATVNNQEA